MTAECKTCGRPAENGTPTHWLGCREVLRAFMKDAAPLPELPDTCDHGECTNPKRPQGKGPKPKYCEDHSDPKNRK